jgi:pyruvate/2-oxoglutarate/acetoin dehydrogenase E1 component
MATQLEELHVEYQRTFGQPVPTMMLPEDPDEAVKLLRRAIATKDDSVFLETIPSDAET